MKTNILISAVIAGMCLGTACNSVNDSKNEPKTPSEESVKPESPVAVLPEVQVVQYEQLMERLQQQNDTVYLVNFWATWCGPCVKELPHFKKLSERMAAEKRPFRLIMVSLDPLSGLKDRVVPFLAEKRMPAEQYLLDDNTRMNEWIPKFDPTWTGAIPVTMIYEGGEKRAFHVGATNEAGLNEILQSYVH